MRNQIFTIEGEEGEFWGIFALFPFSKPAEGKGKKGNNAYRLIPPSPLGSRRFGGG